jgi:hypothetical protein
MSAMPHQFQFSLNKIPEGPGVYALYARDRVLMVGSAPNLRALAEEHLYGQGPSEALRAVIPRPEMITEVSWWQHPAMEDQARRHAAQSVAIQVLSPANRPQGSLSSLAEISLADPEFVKSMNTLFRCPPAGSFVPQSLDDLARSVYELEDKVSALERMLQKKD